MLDRTKDIAAVREHRRLGDYILPSAFLGIAGIAMIVWIGAIAWASWKLISWLS